MVGNETLSEPRAMPPGQSLAGEWRFALDREDAGIAQRWFERTLPDRIKLPGALQAQGYGNEIATDTPWRVALGDAWWKLQPEDLRAKFSQPGAVEVPFLAQPPRHYLGAAWYQRDFEIPAHQAGRRFVLFLERPNWETTVWLNDKPFPANNSLSAPHETDFGVLAPGKYRVTVRIDNRQVVRNPNNDHHGPDQHSISDALGATWNGVAGRIELQSTPVAYLEDVQVFPNIRKKSALVRVKIGNASGQAGTGQLAAYVGPVAGQPRGAATPAVTETEVRFDPKGGSAELEVLLGDNAPLWDEFNPALHRVTVTFRASDSVDTRAVTFGLREVSYRGKDLLVNGRVVNLRTTHFGGDFPLTGYPATDIESWKKIYRTCLDFGMNGIRFHSWCPPEAAFLAADEMGFYLAPEPGLWAPFNPGGPYTRFLHAETPRMLKAYGNSPSFLLMSPSNEPAGRYTQITPQWAADWYAKDPRRLYAAGTGWDKREQVFNGPQYAVLVRFDGGELRNIRGWFDQDYRHALRNVTIPVLAHENGQWCAYPDFDIIDDFTGYLRPSNYRIFREIARRTGVLEFNEAFAWASGRFQLACYKEEIEANLRTPGLSGYQLLDLRDYLGQGTALIGVVDAFWKPKRYVTADEFRRFNGQTVPLVRLGKRSFTTADTLSTPVEVYHFGAQPIGGARAHWKLVDRQGGAVASGELPVRDIPIGKNIPLGEVSIPLSTIPAPAQYRLVIGIGGTKVENDWNVWVYPANVSTAGPADVLVTSRWSEAEQRLAAGGKVLFVPTAGDLPRSQSPAMSRTPVFWNIQMTVRPPRNMTPKFDGMLGLLCQPEHPALAAFPTEPNCDWQWVPLIDRVRSVNLTNAPRELTPIVATIDDWNRNWRLGVVFECTVGEGRLLVSTIDVRKPEAHIGTAQLRRSLLDYMGSERFRPTAKLTAQQASALWTENVRGIGPDRRIFDQDLDDGSRPQEKKQ